MRTETLSVEERAGQKPVVRVEDLRVSLKKRHKQTELVKEVSFEVYPGECLGILGESGSGKSMSVKAMLGILDKNFEVSGNAWFEEKNLIKESKEALRSIRGSKIAVVLQNPMTCFDPLYRIGNQMAETFATHTDWKKEEIFRRSVEILERMKIRNPEEVLAKYPHQLSGGMLQRIMIGIAMALKPALLIADEPTTAIDAITQHEILEEFIRIKQEHQTAMIFITHDLGAISRVADRLIVMNSGEVVDRGDFQHILHHASDSYTRLLVEKRAEVMKKYRESIHGHQEVCHD
ncbi:MAG: ABC transporter ATP-binding protein [Lachnospiraceae bacterium]|jgi:nickel transport system ATP-binding protein